MEILLLIGVLGLIGISWFIDYLWEKWTSKRGAKEAIKEAKIPEQLKEQSTKLEQQKLDMKELQSSISQLSAKISQSNTNTPIQRITQNRSTQTIT